MPILTLDAVADLAWRAGFRGEGLTTSLAVQTAENGTHDTSRVNTTGNRPPSRDRGLWQINDHFHPEVSDAEAFDGQRNADHAYRISSGGTKWGAWSTYNNGAYRKHLDAARTAAANAAARQGGTSGATTGATPPPGLFGASAARPPVPIPYGTSDADQLPVAVAPLGPADLSYMAAGGGGSGGVAERLIGAVIDLTLDEIAQLTLTYHDPGWQLLASGLAVPGLFVTLADLRFVATALEIGPGEAEEQTVMTCHDVDADFLHRNRHEGIVGQHSPTDVALSFGGAVIASQVVEPSPTRDVRKKTDDADPARRLETSWAQMTGYAKDLGYVFNTSAGVLYFARPSYIAATMPGFAVKYRPGHPHEPGEPDFPYAPHGAPQCRRVDATTSNQSIWGVDAGFSRSLILGDDQPATVTVKLPKARAARIRPGMRLELYGCAGFDASYLVTHVAGDLITPDPWTVEAVIPVDPAPDNKALAAATTAGAAATAAATKGTRQASDFAAYCLSMAGKPYIYGAEVSLADPNPRAFDCSELVQWAAAQAGVSIPDGSGNQYQHCKTAGTLIDVAGAARVRGALLFRGPGGSEHVAVSLGDGSTIEARGRAYGVLTVSAGVRNWTAAALVPGLVYNTAVGTAGRSLVRQV